MKITNVKTILWDMDNTLVDFVASQYKSLINIFGSYGYNLTQEQLVYYNDLNNRYWHNFELGAITYHQLINRFEEYFDYLGFRCPILTEEFYELYQSQLGNNAQTFDHALEVLSYCHGKYKQYIITNGAKITQETKIAKTGIAKYIDGIFVSHDIGYQKPAKEYFDAVARGIDFFDNTTAIVIGDSLTSDIQGANNANIRCVWYNPNSFPNNTDLRIDYTISDLAELLELL